MNRDQIIQIMLDAYAEYTKPMKEIGYPMPNLFKADMGFILNAMEQKGVFNKSIPEFNVQKVTFLGGIEAEYYLKSEVDEKLKNG